MDLCIEERRLLLQPYQPFLPLEFPHEKGPRRMRLANYFLHVYSVGDGFEKQEDGPS